MPQSLPKISLQPAAILFVLVISLFQAAAASAQSYSFQLSINPVESSRLATEGELAVKPHLSYELKPEKTVEDALTIHNFSTGQTYNLKVYAVDALQSSDGAIAFKLENAEQQHIGEWVSFGLETVTIKPGETLHLPYSISAPAKVTPGTYQGGLIVELINRNQPANNTEAGQLRNDVLITARLVEPIYISIEGRKKVDYGLDDFSFHQIGNLPSFYLKFSNKGNVFLKTSTKLRISGTLLEKPYEVDLSDSTILQGESLEKVFKFENPPLFGEYKADLVMEISEYNVAKNEQKLLNTVTKSITFNIIPWDCLLFLLILILLIPVFEYCRRKYFKEKRGLTFLHEVKKGETVLSIADLYRLNWKKIIKLNKLPKPYTIKPGSFLELPFPKTTDSSKKKNPPS